MLFHSSSLPQKYISAKLSQPYNAKDSMRTMVFGIIIAKSDLQFLNVPCEILRSSLGSNTERKEQQPSKTSCSIVSTLHGISIESKEEQPRKARQRICLTLLGIQTEVKFVFPRKAHALISMTPEGIDIVLFLPI
jgi:hypothetical protein